MEFTGCKLKFKLNPQSPMIHFQPDEAGATVRATELKPKLDKFLIEKFKRENIQYKAWVSKENDNTKAEALDYKVRISAGATLYKVAVGISYSKKKNTTESYSIYYGNMGDDTIPKAGIISYPIVTIICFKSGLREQIARYIHEFFYVTNFGTMQNKGFGGFLIDGDTPSEEKLIKAFRSKGAKGIYRMDFKGAPISLGGAEPNYAISIKMFENIKRFYSVMKSGQNFSGFGGGYARSYLFKYMHENFEIDNEKAWMKEKGISPNIRGNYNGDVHQRNANPRYVRAMFGKGDQIEYIEQLRPVKKKKITISQGKSNKLERIPSTILFKVIGSYVYILGKSIPADVYNQEFVFSGYKTDSLKTPSNVDFKDFGGEFPMKDFLDKYVDYYNGQCRNDLNDMRRYEKVVKCE